MTTVADGLLSGSPLRNLPFEYWPIKPVDVLDRVLVREMSPEDIPPTTAYTIEPGTNGYGAWAVQRAINEWYHSDSGIVEDGVYGDQTSEAVHDFQQAVGLTPDSRFGPASSTKMAHALERRVQIVIPDGSLEAITHGESGDLIAAVNWTVPGGVDCSYEQRRVYSADMGSSAVKQRAFDAAYQMKLTATNLRWWHDSYWRASNAVKNHERAWRCSTLRHNYPSGADKVAAVGTQGLSSYYTTPQSWVVAIGASFPDGVPIRTPLEWMQHYALGNAQHNEPGMMCRGVTSWPT